jgi:hypothetical protein
MCRIAPIRPQLNHIWTLCPAFNLLFIFFSPQFGRGDSSLQQGKSRLFAGDSILFVECSNSLATYRAKN